MTGTTQELEKPRTRRNGTTKEQPVRTPEITNESEQLANQSEQVTKQEVHEPRGVERTRPGKVYTPPVDIYETGSEVVIVAEMPGVDEKSVDVTLDKNVLTIYGHVDATTPAGHTLAYAEYGTGDYMRSFTISNQLDWQRFEGTMQQGVLRLRLPKAGPAETRKIEIKSA